MQCLIRLVYYRLSAAHVSVSPCSPSQPCPTIVYLAVNRSHAIKFRILVPCCLLVPRLSHHIVSASRHRLPVPSVPFNIIGLHLISATHAYRMLGFRRFHRPELIAPSFRFHCCTFRVGIVSSLAPTRGNPNLSTCSPPRSSCCPSIGPPTSCTPQKMNCNALVVQCTSTLRYAGRDRSSPRNARTCSWDNFFLYLSPFHRAIKKGKRA